MLKAVRQVRRLFGDYALLLQAVAQQLNPAGWKRQGSTAWDWSSSHIDHADRWLPHYLFSFFFNERHQDRLAYASILLEDDIINESYSITEPLITGGVFQFEVGVKVDANYQYEFSKWFGYAQGPNIEAGDATGEVIEMSKKEWENWGEKYPFKKAQFFGFPVVQISNNSTLKSKFAEKLLELLPS